ncbi:hypothetical protein BDW02DRAFT_405221 [Decorospora gaudefroyi]|uniref:Uncharacterized protein n=1 Tax=Decorospora gaudefroyi TaxID=184978 RepID=A0A6A5KEK1_9PLEO|nr:hypothetical protein BDW02DRAFT_405221 [Decorospora gaudefroyi]
MFYRSISSNFGRTDSEATATDNRAVLSVSDAVIACAGGENGARVQTRRRTGNFYRHRHHHQHSPTEPFTLSLSPLCRLNTLIMLLQHPSSQLASCGYEPVARTLLCIMHNPRATEASCRSHTSNGILTRKHQKIVS